MTCVSNKTSFVLNELLRASLSVNYDSDECRHAERLVRYKFDTLTDQ